MKNNYTEEQKEKICDIVYNWMIGQNCHDAEHASQDDNCYVYAIDLACDLAEVVGILYEED